MSLLTLKLCYISVYNHQLNVHEEFSLKIVFTVVLMFLCLFMDIFVLWLLVDVPAISCNKKTLVNVGHGSPVTTGSAKESQFVLM